MMTHDESVSAAAIKILRHLDGRLEKLRVKNDDATLTMDETLVIRAQIAEVKELRKLITTKPVVLADRNKLED